MKLTRTTCMIVGTAGVLLVVVIGLPNKDSQEAQEAPPLASGDSEMSQAAYLSTGHSSAAQLQAQRARSEALIWERNPFELILTPAADPIQTKPEPDPVPPQIEPDPPELVPLPHLSGIAIVDGRPIALLDGELAQTGDQLPSGYIVQAIDSRTVTLSKDQQIETLVL
ncbi:MAG: hypothetical protein ACI8QZ_003840 [Chlamydiales bacterium]|jgi:hypothetical protein